MEVEVEVALQRDEQAALVAVVYSVVQLTAEVEVLAHSSAYLK